MDIPAKEIDESLKEIDENVDNTDQPSEEKEVGAVQALQITVEADEHDEDTSNESTLEAVSVIQENVEVPLQGNDRMDEQNDDEKNDTTIAAPCPDVIPVYSIAILENCPDEKLNDDYGQSIRRFLSSEQHLMQNITAVDLQHMSSRSFRNTHTHTVSVTINVKTARLWEHPAKYVRKHLGLEKYWERSNGTIIKLTRIHQK